MNDTKQKPNNKTNTRNWIIIPKVELREIATQNNNIKCLIDHLEQAHHYNPDVYDYIIIPDGNRFDTFVHAANKSVDEEMAVTLYNHILTHPNNTTTASISPDEMGKRLFEKAQKLVAGKVDKYAMRHVDHAIIMGRLPQVTDIPSRNNQGFSKPRTSDKKSNWIVISRRALRELARHETDVKNLVEKIEKSGEMNPEKFNYICVKDGGRFVADAPPLVTDILIDGEIYTAVWRHLEALLSQKHVPFEQLHEMQEEIYGLLHSDISEIANAYAIYYAEKAMSTIES